MTEIEKLVLVAEMLHDELEKAAKNDKYNDNVQTKLDDLSYEVYKIKSNLSEIKYYLGY